jgi:hypothetical protein
MVSIIGRAFAAAITLALCPAAFAAEGDSGGHGGGETSGPAAGTPTTPNTVIPKQSGSAAATGAGAPGTAGKPGTEAGGGGRRGRRTPLSERLPGTND